METKDIDLSWNEGKVAMCGGYPVLQVGATRIID
jgi:hypothetical protein